MHSKAERQSGRQWSTLHTSGAWRRWRCPALLDLPVVCVFVWAQQGWYQAAVLSRVLLQLQYHLMR